MEEKNAAGHSFLKPNVLDKETFEREIGLCMRLSRENKGCCNWGICKSCGVIPLLYKLHKGILLETPQDIQNVQKETLTLS